VAEALALCDDQVAVGLGAPRVERLVRVVLQGSVFDLGLIRRDSEKKPTSNLPQLKWHCIPERLKKSYVKYQSIANKTTLNESLSAASVPT
jgi:hypothetical protein